MCATIEKVRARAVYKRFVGAMYVMNIIAQAIVTLLLPAALMMAIAWLFVERCGAPGWLYAVLITLGILSGFVSMIRFVIRASEGLERMEQQRNSKTKKP